MGRVATMALDVDVVAALVAIVALAVTAGAQRQKLADLDRRHGELAREYRSERSELRAELRELRASLRIKRWTVPATATHGHEEETDE